MSMQSPHDAGPEPNLNGVGDLRRRGAAARQVVQSSPQPLGAELRITAGAFKD